MTPTNEDLLALAKIICAAMTWPSDFGWYDQSDQYRAKCMDAARCVLVAVRKKPQHGKEVMPNDEDNSHERPAVSPRLTAGAQAIREAAEARAVKVKPRIFMLPDGRAGVCVGGRYDGWMMYRHPDGQWVTDHKMPVSDPSESLPAILAALDVSETPVCDRQTDLLSASERQAIRDKALDDAAQCCEAEADKCDDAVKWGGDPKYIANCKAAAYAMRDRAYTIRLMKGKPE